MDEGHVKGFRGGGYASDRLPRAEREESWGHVSRGSVVHKSAPMRVSPTLM